MVHGRVARGRWAQRWCRRQPLTLVIAVIAVIVALATTGAQTAAASGGGASIGRGGAGHHRHHAGGRRYANPLRARAMWIWELSYTSRGNLATIIARAHRYGVSTVIVKSSDGRYLWSQFTPRLVRELHANGLHVCAWQYVYGERPAVEARLGADAVSDGADCLIIDAESQYEGRYIAAQTYIRTLRAHIGPHFPVALAGFPYVDLHPAFPYSVFLGPGGAQYNAPQMYWRAIGVSVSRVYAHTYSYNLPYRRPIYPLGQLYSNPPSRQILRFRELSRAYGARGVSWWDWQSASRAAWTAMSRPAGDLSGFEPYKVMALVGRGARGDMVVWAQEHLASAGYPIAITGVFGRVTEDQVLAFQSAHRLSADGVIGPETWGALLRYRPLRVDWTDSGNPPTASEAVRAEDSRGGAAIALPLPLSASDPAKRDEIPGSLGAGRG